VRDVPRFVVRSQISDREPIRGFVLRVSRANGYPRTSYVIASTGLTPRFYFEPCDLGRLAALTDNEIGDLQRACYWNRPLGAGRQFGLATVAVQSLMLSRLKICMECLGDADCIDRLWDLKHYVWCHRHHALLFDRCSKCGRGRPWHRAQLERCKCVSLMQAPNQLLSDRDRNDLQSISEKIAELELKGDLHHGPWPDMRRHLKPQSLAPYLALLEFLGNPAIDSEWRSVSMEKPYVSAQLHDVLRAARIIDQWPDSLGAWLDARRKSLHGPSVPSLTAEFGRHLHRLRLLCNEYPALETLQAAIRDALRKSPMQRFPVRNNSTFGPGSSGSSVVSASLAAQEIGVRVPRIRELVKTGILAGEIVKVGSRKVCAVSQSSLNALKDDEAGLVCFREASENLGISTHQVNHLRLHGILQGKRGLRGKWSITQESIDELKDTLFRVSTQVGDSVERIALSQIVTRRTGALPWAIRAALSQRVPVFYEDQIVPMIGILSRLTVRLSDISKGMLELCDADRWITSRAAARSLSISQRMIVQLRRQGLLGEQRQELLGPKRDNRVRISVDALSRFRQTFTMSREIAALTKTSPRQVLALAETMGISPAVQPDNRKGISAVWNKGDAERIKERLASDRPSGCSLRK
jgi:hypothetical protein